MDYLAGLKFGKPAKPVKVNKVKVRREALLDLVAITRMGTAQIAKELSVNIKAIRYDIVDLIRDGKLVNHSLNKKCFLVGAV
jgi:predicted ArsR family transcriptional regulator